MPDQRVLVVDDEESIRRFLRVALSSQGYTVIERASGQAAISAVNTEKPDVLILDLGLPDMDGVEIIKLLRGWTRVPIMVLSVRGSESDKIAALDAGADDYLTKPFGVGELLARLRAAVRRSGNMTEDSIFETGTLRVDPAKRLVTVSEKEVPLTPNEYGLLRVMASHAGKTLTHGHLLREVWGAEFGGESHMLHVNISNLRHKIEPDPAHPRFIITESGVGYRLKVD